MFNYVILQEADAQFLAAYAIVTNIAFVSKGLLNGFAQAAQPMLSANHGAKRGGRVKQSFLISIRYGLYFSLIVYALLLLFPYQVAEVFAQDSTEVVRIGADGIRLYFTSLPLSALITMLLYYFQSIEEGRIAMLLAFLKGVVYVLICLFLLVSLFGIGAVWFTVTMAEGLAVLSALLFLKKRRLYG